MAKRDAPESTGDSGCRKQARFDEVGINCSLFISHSWHIDACWPLLVILSLHSQTNNTKTIWKLVGYFLCVSVGMQASVRLFDNAKSFGKQDKAKYVCHMQLRNTDSILQRNQISRQTPEDQVHFKKDDKFTAMFRVCLHWAVSTISF